MGAGAADIVDRYLGALAARDWEALAATVAPDVLRIGPYGDVHNGRDEYVSFLRDTVEALPGYVLEVARVVDAGTVAFVELNETVDDGDARLRTHEGIVFDVDGSDLIARIAVYLRSSVRI